MLDDRTREYAEWYVWAKRNLTSTPEICHAAAQAATEAKAAGRDPQVAARDAGTSRGGPGWTQPADPQTRLFAEWYDWARVELGASGDSLTRAATAAVDSLRYSPDSGAAASAARASLAAAGEAVQQTAAAPPPPQLQPAPPPPPPPPPAPAAAPPPPPQGAWSPPNPPMGSPYPGSALPPPPTQPPVYAPGYGPPHAGAATYTPAFGPPTASGRVEVPVWVAILLGIGCAASLFIAIVYAAILAGQPTDQSLVIGSASFLLVGLLMFFPSVIALVGVVRHTGWARAMSIVAGAVFCISCVGIIFGLPVIIGAAMAKPQPEWRTR